MPSNDLGDELDGVDPVEASKHTVRWARGSANSEAAASSAARARDRPIVQYMGQTYVKPSKGLSPEVGKHASAPFCACNRTAIEPLILHHGSRWRFCF